MANSSDFFQEPRRERNAQNHLRSSRGTLIGWSARLGRSSRSDRGCAAPGHTLLACRKGRLRRSRSSLPMGADLGLWSLSVRLRAVRRVLAPLALLGDHLSTSARPPRSAASCLPIRVSSLGTSRFGTGSRGLSLTAQRTLKGNRCHRPCRGRFPLLRQRSAAPRAIALPRRDSPTASCLLSWAKRQALRHGLNLVNG